MTTNEKALMLHEEWNGKLETVSKATVASREDLALDATVAFDTVSSFPFHSSWSINAFSLVVMMDSVLFL